MHTIRYLIIWKYEEVSLISVTGAANCTAVVLAWCNGVRNSTQLGGRADFTPFHCSHVSGLMWFRDRYNETTSNWHNWGDRDRTSGGAQHPNRKQLPGWVLKMAEALGKLHMRVRGLLQEWLWPIGPKLDFDQMAAPILEIMGGSLYVSRAGCNSRFMLGKH
jgi:hypothetical protein